MKKTIVTIILLIGFIFQGISIQAQSIDSITSVSFLAFGDVNLGRAVGQKILKGDTSFPFQKIEGILKRADIIFANLECPVTDQNGETQSPKSNVVFCGPPGAAVTLRKAGVTVVSTANNHAYDYGLKGLRETIKFLSSEGIQFTGTVNDSGLQFIPVIIERKGIKFGIVAYTKTMNFGVEWNGFVSLFDSARGQQEIATLKPEVDFIIASYHSGEEYKDIPDECAIHNIRLLAEFGVDVVIGHHPHVTQGIEIYQECMVFYSLGNAVFNQPQKYWTQRSFAVLIGFEKYYNRKTILSIELIPFRPGFQPTNDLSIAEKQELINRTQKLSNVSIKYTERGYFVEPIIAHSSQ